MASCFFVRKAGGCVAALLIAASGLLPGQSAPGTQVANAAPEPAVMAPRPASQLQATPEELGDAYMLHQRYQAAIDAYRNSGVDTPALWNKLGVAHQLLFDNKDAERCYKRALKLNPKDANALNNMGSVYMELKLYASAERSFRKAVRVDPKSALYHKNLGTAYLAQGRYKKGWREYEAALAADPEVLSHNAGARIQNPASLRDRGAMNFYMAKSCAHAGLFAQAVEYLRMALNEGFTNPKKILADSELARMRAVPAFQQLMAAQGVYVMPLTVPAPVRQ